MIIKELTLHNFGVYASTNTFKFKADKPIVLIGGMNGRGKTTFLDAVLLALYGSNSFAYNESYHKSYGQYLKSFVNKNDGTLDTYIELEFSNGTDENETYRIRREWSGAKRRVLESITVYRGGKPNKFLTDNWSMFMENILPSGLSNFFFFDGEKIAELAVERTSKQMKESIKALLGISVLDLLKGDIWRIINRTAKKQTDDKEAKRLEELREKRDNAVSALASIDSEIEELELKKTKKTQLLEQRKQEYSSKGGDIVSQRNDLFQQRNTLISHLDMAQELLITDAASELPLVLVEELLTEIRNNAEIEQDQKLLNVAFAKIQALSDEFNKENGFEDETIDRFVEYVKSKTEQKEAIVEFNLSDSALFKLQMLLDEQLSATQAAISNRISEQQKIQAEISQLDSYMSVEIDEKAIAKLFRKIKELEQDIISLDVLIEKKTEERKTYNYNVITATSEFNHKVEEYLKSAELNDDSDRILKYSHMALTILDEYSIRLQKNKIEEVAETMTNCYKHLANKKTLIDHVEMDPVTLDFKYINSDGIEVEKVSLSAGEKQLMVISLLWSLAICSKKKLPVIIDTPLSRLDSAHRSSIISTYFPQASDQTIILSTDEEIDDVYYDLMKENIGDEFTLEYDDQSKSTTIKKGYLQGAKYDS